MLFMVDGFVPKVTDVVFTTRLHACLEARGGVAEVVGVDLLALILEGLGRRNTRERKESGNNDGG